tara:strand:- start:40 stop:285 length:246 start_codon:yes stop_codon:yes gene_type:complete
MDDKTRARYKDDILEYLLAEYNLKESRAIGARDIARVVFKKQLNEKQVEELCEEIISDDLNILKKGSNFTESTYSATDKNR